MNDIKDTLISKYTFESLKDRLKDHSIVCKTYKEFCQVLNIPVRAGNQKIAQLKRLTQEIHYHIDGRQYIIDGVVKGNEKNIYKDIVPIIDLRHKQSEVQELMKEGLLSVLNCYNGNSVQLTYVQLFKIFGMVNGYYDNVNIFNLKQLSGLQDKSDGYLSLLQRDFYSNVHSEFKRILLRTFKSLQKQKILIYMSGYNIIKTLDTTVCANKKEISYILGVEGRVLKEFGLKDSKDLFFSQRQEAYYNRVKNIVNEEKGWITVYPIIDIVYNRAKIRSLYSISDLKQRMNAISVKRAKAVTSNKIRRTNKKAMIDLSKREGKNLNYTEVQKIFSYDKEYITDIDKIIDCLVKI